MRLLPPSQTVATIIVAFHQSKVSNMACRVCNMQCPAGTTTYTVTPPWTCTHRMRASTTHTSAGSCGVQMLSGRYWIDNVKDLAQHRFYVWLEETWVAHMLVRLVVPWVSGCPASGPEAPGQNNALEHTCSQTAGCCFKRKQEKGCCATGLYRMK